MNLKLFPLLLIFTAKAVTDASHHSSFFDFYDSLDSKKMDEYCHQRFNDLVSSMHNFSDCVMQNSLSYAACSSCGEHLRFFEKTKHKLESDERQDKNNKTCAEALHDTKISLIDYEEGTPFRLWKNGSCDKCYDLDERRHIATLHPAYTKFERLFRKYRECTANYRNGAPRYVCTNCSDSYRDFVEYFHESVNLKSDYLHCLDVKQKLNASAHEWREVFGCKRMIKSDRFATLIFTAFSLLLPFAFYLAVYVRSDANKVELVQLDHRTSFEGADDADMPDDEAEDAPLPPLFELHHHHEEENPSHDAEDGTSAAWPARRVRTSTSSVAALSPTTNSPRRVLHHQHNLTSTDSLLL